MADYKQTINLPQTGFSMKADLANREPAMLAAWERDTLYEKIRAASQGRPSFVLTIDGKSGTAKGSARTIPGFNLADAIRAHPKLMAGGGHAMAAGCTMLASDIEAAATALDAYAGSILTPEDFVPSVRVDMEVAPQEVNLQAAEALTKLEPYGFSNPEPVFLSRNLTVAQILPTKNPAHVRLVLRTESGSTVPGIAFGIGERLTESGAGVDADLLFQANVDEWKGARTLKWQIKDFVQS